MNSCIPLCVPEKEKKQKICFVSGIAGFAFNSQPYFILNMFTHITNNCKDCLAMRKVGGLFGC